MRQQRQAALTAAAAVLLSSTALASDLTLDGQNTSLDAPIGSTFTIELKGGSGLIASVSFDVSPGPITLFGESVPLGFTPALQTLLAGTTDAAGSLSAPLTLPAVPSLVGQTFYFAGATLDPLDPNGIDFSNGVALTIEDDTLEPIELDLFGVERPGAPFFDWVTTTQESNPIRIAIDPADQPQLAGTSARVFLVADKSQADWDADPSLVDLSGNGSDLVAFTATDVQSNTFVIDFGTVSGDVGASMGRGYDVVIDVDGDNELSTGDLVDGYVDGAGLYVSRDPSLPGPYSVVELTYSAPISFGGQNLFYPANIADLDQVHLVVVSHGNGHNYQWYDHIGNHLASYGYVVMSHQNNTVPGIASASTTTLTNTEAFLAGLDTIAGGVLDGKIIRDEIAWIGHSRGGEGIVRAYDRLVDNQFTSVEYDDSDIVLLSSIAPTVFLGPTTSDPHDVDFHLWTGAGDSDVNGCSQSDVTQCPQLYGRAENQRQSTALYGVGHAWFHNGTGAFISGPCQLNRSLVHEIMRGYLLPLMEWHLRENPAALDFLVRQYEDLRPTGVQTPAQNPCVVVNLQYSERVESGKLVIENFQTELDPLVASSGVPISNDLDGWVTARADDSNTNFTNGTDPMNGTTYAQNGGPENCGALLYAGGTDRTLTFDLGAGTDDWSDFGWFNFRAAQVTRAGQTIAALEDHHLTVRLVDTDGDFADMATQAIGAGLEEPYQRTGCGTGVGWNNEFENVRMGLRGFRAINPALDLDRLDRLEFKFGPSFGAPDGRLVIDDIEVTFD
ncbi:MAG: poly(ethylene terephthalate) hydrolase family protein [Planctomycetota bacterium]|jgi:hypothetical protein